MRVNRAALAALAALALVPSAAAAEPNGQGLFPHATTCGDATELSSFMLLTGGASVWVDGSHYLIHDYTVDGVAGQPLGRMTGLVDRGTISCHGTLNGAVVSTEYLIK